MRLLLLLLLSLLAPPALSGCASRADCGLAGECRGGRCVCERPFSGPNCTQLALARADPAAFRAIYRADSASWGGSPLYDSRSGTLHIFAADMVNHCGLNSW